MTPTETTFEKARKLYPGVKRGYDTELLNLKKHHKDWKQVLSLLLPAIEKQILWRKSANGEFRPPWKNFQTWINNRCWEEEYTIQAKTELYPCDVCKAEPAIKGNAYRKDGEVRYACRYFACMEKLEKWRGKKVYH